MTSYDTGTAANRMSLAQAKGPGLTVTTTLEETARFRLANGKIIRSIGRTSAQISFKKGSEKNGQILCFFNVFETLAIPILMGLKFLDATETLSRFRDRLVDLPSRMLRSLRVCTIGNGSNEVVCVVNGREVHATGDTGSEIALISGRYARSRRLKKLDGVEEIQFADGSIGYTSGAAVVTLSLGQRPSHG